MANKNLLMRSSRKSVMVRPKPLPAKQRAHKRKVRTKQGRRDIIVNPENVPKQLSGTDSKPVQVKSKFDKGIIRFPSRRLKNKPKRPVLIAGMEGEKTFKTVKYNQIKPITDGLAKYKGQVYTTKEDLKYMPEKVRLVEIGNCWKGVR